MAKESAKSGKESAKSSQLPTHGAPVLPSVEVKSYNVEIEDEDGFVGDKAGKGAFWELLDELRKPLKKLGDDPLGDKPSEEIGKKKLAALLTEGEPEAAGVVQSAVEEFAQQFTKVIRRFLRLKEWRDTECLVIGGGFRASRIGELAIGRSAVLLKADGVDIDLELIRNDPDEAGLIGGAHLLPAWMLKGHDALLAVDVGGTNIRAGLVELNLRKASDLGKARVAESKLWRHSDEEIDREDAVERADRNAARADRPQREEQAQPRARHRHRLSGRDPRGRLDRARRPEPARQLGEQPLQSSHAPFARASAASASTRRWSSCTTMRSFRD